MLCGALALATLAYAQDASGQEDESGPPSNYNKVRMAHAILGPVAFALLFPFGAMFIRVFDFRGMVWAHAGWMMATYTVILASMGMGVWMAVMTDALDTAHAVIGLVVVGCLLVQPITGLTHHLLWKRSGRPNPATYFHIWWGRAIITLGIINGGLGLQLSGNTTKGEIIYGVVAGVIWSLWVVLIVTTFVRTQHVKDRRNSERISPSLTGSDSRRHRSSV